MKNRPYSESLKYWTIGIQYLHLTQHVCGEIISQENCLTVVSDSEISAAEYFEKTKWADHNLVIPLLFNLYHGIELVLKGFLIARKSENKSHRLSSLLKTFSESYDSKEVYSFFEKYIKTALLPELLSKFCSASGMTMDEYYQAL